MLELFARFSSCFIITLLNNYSVTVNYRRMSKYLGQLAIFFHFFLLFFMLYSLFHDAKQWALHLQYSLKCQNAQLSNKISLLSNLAEKKYLLFVLFVLCA